MTAACLELLHDSKRPIWPWADSSAAGLLVEAFPAAQLQVWGLPFQGYNGDDDAAPGNRAKIVQAVLEEVALGSFLTDLEKSADALDAVLCAFAAIAVSENELALPRQGNIEEGWIAVHTALRQTPQRID